MIVRSLIISGFIVFGLTIDAMAESATAQSGAVRKEDREISSSMAKIPVVERFARVLLNMSSGPRVEDQRYLNEILNAEKGGRHVKQLARALLAMRDGIAEEDRTLIENLAKNRRVPMGLREIASIALSFDQQLDQESTIRLNRLIDPPEQIF